MAYNYSKTGRQYDDGGNGSNFQYQDGKFRDNSIKSLQTCVRAIKPDEAYTSLKPSWCDICSAKVACHHKEV